MSRPAGWKWEPLGETEDPVPGDVAELKALARRLSATAETIKDTAAALRRLGELESWDSDAGREFAAKAGETAETVGRAHHRYAEAGAAVKEFWTDLEQIQAEADRLLAQAETAANAATAARRKADDPPEDTDAEGRRGLDFRAADAEAHLAEIRRRLAPLKSWHKDAGDRAARRIKDAVEGDGLNDGWLDDLRDALTAIANAAGLIAAVCGLLSLALGWIPVIGQALAGLLGTVALVATAVSLACHLTLAANGDATWQDVAMDVLGLATFGIGRVFSTASRMSARLARSRVWNAADDYVRNWNRGLDSRQRRAMVEEMVGARAGATAAAPAPEVTLRAAFGGLGRSFADDLSVLSGVARGTTRPGNPWTAVRSAAREGGFRGLTSLPMGPDVVAEFTRIRNIAGTDLAFIGAPDAFRQAFTFHGLAVGATGVGGFADGSSLTEGLPDLLGRSPVDQFLLGNRAFDVTGPDATRAGT